jgi:CRP-like cAMP-binding protein
VLLDPPLLVTTVEAAVDGEVFAIPRLRLLELFDLQPMIGLQVYRAAAKVFEGRYRKTLDGLVTALRSALQAAISGTEIAH